MNTPMKTPEGITKETPEDSRDTLWKFIEKARERTRVRTGDSSHFFLSPGFPLPGHIVKEDLIRIPDDEILTFSKAREGTLTKEEFDAYNKKFPEINEENIATADPLRYALLYYIRSRIDRPEEKK